MRPGLLADGASGVGGIFVEGDEFAEVDLFVQEVLERGGDVVGVVVCGVVVVVAAVGVVLVVAVGVGHGWFGVVVLVVVLDGGGGVALGELGDRQGSMLQGTIGLSMRRGEKVWRMLWGRRGEEIAMTCCRRFWSGE